MRITAKVAGAGSNGLTRLPFLDITSIDADLCTDGRLDEAKCRRALNHPDDGIQINAEDCLPVFAFVTELLKQTHDACVRLIENRRDGNTLDAHAEADCADDRHAERNMTRGKWVFVRTDVNYKYPTRTVQLRVNVDNPKHIVGVAERIAIDYALVIARIANNIRDQLTASHENEWAFEFVGGAGCPTLFEEARRIDAELTRKAEVKEQNVAMWKCERRTASGHCSPICPTCEHYRNGLCVEVVA